VQKIFMGLSADEITVIREIQESSSKIIAKHNKDGSITLPDGVLLLSSTTISALVLITTIINLARSLQIPLSDMISPIRKSDIMQSKGIESMLHELLGVAHTPSRCCIGIFEKAPHRVMRITYEATSPGVDKHKKSSSLIPLNIIHSEIILSDAKEFVAFSRSDTSLPNGCHAYMDDIGVKLIISRLFSSAAKILGGEPEYDAILNIQYAHTPELSPLDDQDTLEEMKIIFNRLLRAIAQIKKRKKISLF
jgi:hypothetical protein